MENLSDKQLLGTLDKAIRTDLNQYYIYQLIQEVKRRNLIVV